MTNADATHFNTYRKQTAIKHHVLREYLWAYFTALSKQPQTLTYVDGFAGAGMYRDGDAEYPGSPLLALQLLAENKNLRARVNMVFIEDREDHFQRLLSVSGAFCDANPEVPRPMLIRGKFSKCFPEAQSEIARKSGPPGPTFLFVDPCGVDGTSFQIIAQVLRTSRSELFIFFNSSGIERVIGAAMRSRRSATLADLFGSEARVSALLDAVDGKNAQAVEEHALLQYMIALQTDAKARYVLPYRIEAETRKDTSHYLIHACSGCLGFKIMKHVMAEAMPKDHPGCGLLELRQASAKDQVPLFRFDLAALKRDLVNELLDAPKNVGELIRNRVCQPSDYYSEKTYKTTLIQLESEGRISVFSDQECKNPCPASERPRPKGKITLGDPKWVKARVDSAT